MGSPARRHPSAASHVRAGTTGAGASEGERRGRHTHPSNHAPELRGSIPGAARRC
jgi:hypothetical protein